MADTQKLRQGFRTFFLPIIILPPSALFIVLFFGQKAPVDLFPITQELADSTYYLGTYADGIEFNNGSSISKPLITDSTIQYSYTIRAGATDPYAGLDFNFYIHTPSHLLNLQNYTHLDVEFDLAQDSIIDFYIKAVVPEYTKPDDRATHGILHYSAQVSDGHFKQEIPLSTFNTPDWWYSARRLSSEKTPRPYLGQVMAINFQNAHNATSDVPITVTIKKLAFVQDNTRLFTLSALICGLYVALLFAIRMGIFARFSRNKSYDYDDDGTEKIIIAYNRVEISSEQNNEILRITEYLASNYSNPDLSVEKFAKGAGVSATKIPLLLKKKFAMNFKQYLNTVRIAEAKRLLTETEHQIVTIAHSVGYNNIPHFNRTFKHVTGLSPKMYRKDPTTATETSLQTDTDAR